jgi:outer membrane murein-binding lipoprotein Lpp
MQVDTLSAQVAELTEQVKDMPALQKALETAKREQADAEQTLHVAVHENQHIQQQARCRLLLANCLRQCSSKVAQRAS